MPCNNTDVSSKWRSEDHKIKLKSGLHKQRQFQHNLNFLVIKKSKRNKYGETGKTSGKEEWGLNAKEQCRVLQKLHIALQMEEFLLGT